MLSPSLGAGAPRVILALCLTLPWLNGFTAGPSPNFWPLWGAAVLGVAVLLQWRQLDARLMAQAWLAAALLSSLLAVLQYFGLVADLAPWVSPSEVGQSYGNLRQRNHFASLTSIGLVCLLALQAWHSAQHGAPSPNSEAAMLSRLRRLGHPRRLGRLKRFSPSAWAIAAAALLALGNAASSSRTGFLQWALILAVLLAAALVQKSQRRRPQTQRLTRAAALSVWATACYAVFSLLLPRSLLAWRDIEIGSLAERLASSGQDSRRVLWDNVLHLIAQKPWSGWGWGELDYAHFITLYPGGRFPQLLDNAHNLPLQLTVELGLPATIAVGLVLAALIWRAKPWHEREAGRLMAWGVLAVIGVHSLLEYPLWYGPFQWTCLFCAMWLWRTRSRARAGAVAEALSPVKAWIPAGLAWSALAVMALDYARVSQLYLPAAERWASFRLQPLVSLNKTGGSLFFRGEVDFAWLVTTPLTAQNAEEMHTLALSLLHYSPEPRVVERLIASAVLTGRNEVATLYLSRYRAAFSGELWVQLLERHPAWALHIPS